MIVSDIVEHFAAATPDRTAVVDRGREIGYAALNERIRRRAAAVAGLGVRRGDRVATLSADRVEHLELICALSRVGAVWVAVNHRLTLPEVAHILADSGAVGLFYSEEHRELAHEAAATGGAWARPLRDEPAAGPGGERPSAGDDFCIMYTSGTTGRPKGAVLTHRQFLAGAYYLACGAGITAADRILLGPPQFHAGGAIYQFAHLLAGASVVLLPRFDPELVERAAAAHGVGTLGLVPTMMHALADRRPPSQGRVRRVLYGGSPVSRSVLRRMMAAYPVEFVQTYGQTEAGVIVTILDGDAHRGALAGDERLLASCGKPLLGYRVRLDGVTGGIGEVMVDSESVMRGYWRRPEATEAALAGGWLRTGDMGSRDERGFLYIHDRKSAMIISGGENVYPLEVERVLAEHPLVDEVAVIGVPDERWGEVVKAVVVSAGRRPELAELREHCRGRLAGFKIPKLLEHLPVLPRNAAGKVTKHRLSSHLVGQPVRGVDGDLDGPGRER
ncbi:AMP-binding protein [Pseudonocardia acaciae]|uniref:AMP-binding protein n=1 Tax=Pseudonocardia acaciae TaxID=551276 RepID=UPI000685A9C9|nr:AMP-binding protein [Pseudonocardia acaciae]